jgi:ABC-2 type transport system ATP-binding protein/lipopolysaccharide transport system ATP-binding protein
MAAVSLEHVTVRFPIYQGAARSLRHRLISASTGGRIGGERGQLCVEALTDISFKLEHGDRLALIGHNGAGKTTLLRVLAGIYTPESGTVKTEGRIAPLFDAGFGMDMDASGYDNIRLRGLYLGLTKSQVEERMPDIVEFTELGSFLEMPMRTYSAGMQARLSFAISTSIDPEILLLDEGIGAGDAAFVEKAGRRMQSFVERTGILVLASHSNELIRKFCNKGALVNKGKLLHFGPLEEVIEAYETHILCIRPKVDHPAETVVSS